MKTLKSTPAFRLTVNLPLFEVGVHRMQLTAKGCKQLVDQFLFWNSFCGLAAMDLPVWNF
jgi:hypothetical protein